MPAPLKYKRTKDDWVIHARAFDVYAKEAEARSEWALLEGLECLAAMLRGASAFYRMAASEVRYIALTKET